METAFIMALAAAVGLWAGWLVGLKAAARKVDLSRLDEAWAWGSDDSVSAALQTRCGKLVPIKRGPTWMRIVSAPSTAVLLIAVLTYRRFFRVTTLSPICLFEPSCSSYAIGMLRRYPVWIALPQIIRRLRECNGMRTGIDLLPHLREVRSCTTWQSGA